MLYEVALYEPNPYERCHEATRRFTVGSLRAAELAAESILKPHKRYETDYSARTTRYPWVDITALTKVRGTRLTHHKQATTIEPELHYVPSVGDLGWTP
jgi:hypothetical protein